MSADKEATKNGDMEVEGASSEENPDTPESKPVADSKDSDESSSKGRDKETPKKKSKGRDAKKYEVKDEEEENGESDDDEDDEDDDGKVPLLDQPLEMSGTRERKKVQRFTEEYKVEAKEIPVEIPEGKGIQLGNISLIDANIQKVKADNLKPLHKLLFNRLGKATLVKRNIRKFNGFDFDEKSEQYAKKKQVLLKVEVKVLKEMCSILNLKKTKKREELVEDVLNFLIKPEGSEEPIEKKQKRASRTSKSYSESDDEEKRPKSRRGKMKRVSLKEVSTDEEDFDDEKEEKDSDEEKSKKKEKKQKEIVKEVKNDIEDDDENEKDEEDEEEEDEVSSEDSEGPKSKRGKGRGGKKNSKASVKKSNVKKAPIKKTEKKPAPKKRAKSDDESSEDEPLVKKGKDPPTDEEIKSYVKQILEGANLEETTMKIVCKQVYAHYPEFDLAHKKDFIKETVKSLIQP